MGNYLVLKNNYKRLLSHKLSIGMILVIPVILCLITLLSGYVENNFIRVGILTDGMKEESIPENIKKMMEGGELIDYRLADAKSIRTDQIMGKYNFLLDLREQPDKEQSILALKEMIQKREVIGKEFHTTERTVALLMTVFIILSTVHATNYIEDKKTGLLQRYTVAPRKKYSYLGGYALFTTTVVFVQAMVSLAVLVLLQTGIHITVFKGFLVIAFITAITSLLAMGFTLLSKSDMQANLCSSAFSVIMMLLGGTFVPIERMPKIFQIASLFSPVRWIIGLL